MDIKKISVVEIKALLYDLLSEKEKIEHNINILKKELQERSIKKEEEKKEAE